MTLRQRAGRGLTMTLAMILAAEGHAQEGRPEVLRDRTGPNAAPAPVPDFATPPPAAPARAPVPAQAVASGTVNLADVSVDSTYAAPARPLPGWQSEADPALGLTLLHRPGELFDGAWVRRQFEGNGMIGAPVPLDRVVALVEAINRAFVANGYINSGVLVTGSPPADGGTLQLQLVSGRLADAVTVSWGPHGRNGLSDAWVRRRLGAAGAVPLNAAVVERQFRLLAEHPAVRSIDADLQPGARPGEARLAVTVDPQPRFDLYSTFANSRSPSIGGERFAVGIAMRNLFAGGDLISAEGGWTGGHGDVAVGYEAPVFDTRTTFILRGFYNEAAVVDAQLRPLDIESTDRAFEAGIAHRIVERPLLPTAEPGRWRAARVVSLGFRLLNRRTESFLLGEPFSFSPGSADGVASYNALRLTADWVERNVSQVAALSLTLTQGLGGTSSDIPGLPSPEGDFRAALVQASFARRIDASGLELRFRLTGQWADGLLYSGERLAAGGEFSVRGYRETLLLTDVGLIGSAELARPFSLTGGRRDGRGNDWGAFSASIFADGAIVGNRGVVDPVPDQLASVGVSLAWVPSDAIFARITYAEALEDPLLVGSRDLQDRGIQFRITVRPLALLRRR
jgi:hemolysin activation/secretion protein